MKKGRLYINEEMVKRENERPFVMAKLPKSLRSSGYYADNMIIKGNKVWVDNKLADFNYTIEYKSDSYCNQTSWNCGVIKAKEYDETLPNGIKHSIVEISDDMQLDNTEIFTVPENNYFFMGDNRDQSGDSRESVGFVPFENILGHVSFVWYSHNYYAPMIAVWSWGNKIRWERFGMDVK